MEVPEAYRPIFFTNKKYNVLWGGAGSAKSESIGRKLITKVINQTYCKPICLRKNYVSIKDSIFTLLVRIIAKEGLGNEFKITRTPLNIVCKRNGNQFIFRGMNDEVDREKIKSIVDPTDAWMEEANEFDEEDFKQIRLRLRGGDSQYPKQIYLSFNGISEDLWLFSNLIDSKVFKDRLLELNTSYKDNPFLDKEYIEELESFKSEDDNYYRVYAKGLRGQLRYRGIIYKKYDDKLNVCKYKYNPLLPIIVACDFNIDPMKWALIQNVNGIDYIFDEVVDVDTYTEKQCGLLLDRYGTKTKYIFYGDYSGNFGHTSSKTTDWEIIKIHFPTAEIITTPAPYVLDRTNVVNWRLCNKDKVRRLMVSENCENVRYDFKYAKFIEGRREEDKSKEKYDGKNPINALIHITSAIGYYCEKKYSLKGKTTITHGKFR